MYKYLQCFIVCIILLCMTGCVCTDYVENIGKTKYSFAIKSTCVDAEGNIICRADVYSTVPNERPYRSKAEASSRYIILNAPYAQRVVSDSIANRQPNIWPAVVGINNLTFPQSPKKAKEATGWYVYPPDLYEDIDEPYLPVHLSGEFVDCLTVDRNSDRVGVKYELDGKICYVDIYSSNSVEITSPDKVVSSSILQTILFVPAAIVDFVTFPIQFCIIAGSIR